MVIVKLDEERSTCSFVGSKDGQRRRRLVSSYWIWAGNSTQSVCTSLEPKALVLGGSARWKGISGQKRQGGEQEGMASESPATWFHQPKPWQPYGDAHRRLRERLQSRCR